MNYYTFSQSLKNYIWYIFSEKERKKQERAKVSSFTCFQELPITLILELEYQYYFSVNNYSNIERSL